MSFAEGPFVAVYLLYRQNPRMYLGALGYYDCTHMQMLHLARTCSPVACIVSLTINYNSTSNQDLQYRMPAVAQHAVTVDVLTAYAVYAG